MRDQINPPERIQKFLSNRGFGSRREIEKWISQGQVKVNGETARLGDRIRAEDKLEIGGRMIPMNRNESLVPKVILYNKPEGEVCTRTDPQGRATVFERLPKLEDQRWVVVGRLDLNTSGLLLFTTDGDFANRLMHPASRVEREYAVRVYGEVTPEIIQNLKKGIMLEDGLAAFNRIEDRGGEGKNHWYHIVLSEGKNREVRRMWESQGVQVSRLIRVRFGHLLLPRDLKTGQCREIEQSDIEKLEQQIGVKLKRRTGLYGRAKVRAESLEENKKQKSKRSGYLRRRRP